MTRPSSFIGKAGQALISISAWPGHVAAWCFLPMLFGILALVIASLLRVNEMLAWSFEVPLFGDSLSLTSLSELQWHFLVVMVMMGGAYSLAENRHIYVDVFSSRFSMKTAAAIRLVGDLALLLPFIWIVASHGVSFTEFAYRTGEQSNQGGLTDRWLVKAFLPAGMALLGVTVVGRVLLSVDILMTSGGKNLSEKGPR